MFMCDIPPHDMSSDFLVMAEQREIEAEKLWQVQVSGWQEVWGCVAWTLRGSAQRTLCVFARVLSFLRFTCVYG